MWHRLKNIFLSFQTYSTLSPDIHTRRQVNRKLHRRSALSLEEWFENFDRFQKVSQPVLTFAYTHLAEYSGIDFTRVLPSDRLEEDLLWSQVCWFDWEDTLSNDFWETFEIDIRERLSEQPFSTVKDLIIFLDFQLLDPKPISRDIEFS